MDEIKKKSIVFIILVGLLSLFADMTYEGARSISGQYLEILGASSAVVGFIGGLGELLGYAIRYFSGRLADKTHRYWVLAIVGYFINLLSVPLIAFFPFWQWAILPMMTERIGKGIRVPPKDAMLSFATKSVGRGWGFGIHEFLDQIGAVSGPIFVASVLFFLGENNFRYAFFFLFLPASCAIGILFLSRFLYPVPSKLEINLIELDSKGLPKLFWIYCFCVLGFAVGFLDFVLIAFHLEKTEIISQPMIPLLYAFAMGVDGVSAILFGKLFDKNGFIALLFAIVISVFANPLIFLSRSIYLIVVGMICWGVGLGALESIIRAAVANIVPVNKRGSAFGIFNTLLGVFWFVGSFACGILYGISPVYLVMFSLIAQLFSVASFIYFRNSLKV
ncbi:major facilitator superfamily MFS_1 [Thermodesulfobium narugense DSM 14796]|uniref:Major facilitator superfamily MFS_1 n=1 Tax=Thermodesulfobium narugense DSM 14796 TaxID=747365 RepID=M1E6W6_9BACT|nr:MFS transporter [Thermodesulfobium narugense]AEE15016.1 major facilitator superfamily MFS_1 [Thermodesulfobium narugense DSM 14796]